METQELKSVIETFIKGKCEEYKDETLKGSDAIGASLGEVFEVNGKKYDITGDCFWEKADWYEYKAKGIGFEFELTGHGNF